MSLWRLASKQSVSDPIPWMAGYDHFALRLATAYSHMSLHKNMLKKAVHVRLLSATACSVLKLNIEPGYYNRILLDFSNWSFNYTNTVDPTGTDWSGLAWKNQRKILEWNTKYYSWRIIILTAHTNTSIEFHDPTRSIRTKQRLTQSKNEQNRVKSHPSYLNSFGLSCWLSSSGNCKLNKNHRSSVHSSAFIEFRFVYNCFASWANQLHVNAALCV